MTVAVGQIEDVNTLCRSEKGGETERRREIRDEKMMKKSKVKNT
jgi:hypothetical protein